MLTAKFHGTSYEIGFNHGKQFSKEIHKSYENHCNFDFTGEKLDSIRKDIQEKLEADFPEVMEELRGISEGSHMDLKKILELNYWEEINALNDTSLKGLCTSIAFKNTPQGPIMGKTSDIEVMQRNEYMLQRITPEKGYKILHLGKVGTLKSEIGLNEKGLCIGTSSTMPLDIEGSQIERMTLVRLVLQYCSNVKEAVEFFRRYRFYILGLNILVMDSSGEAVVIEKGIANQEERMTCKNYIFATNFFVCEHMVRHFNEKAWYYCNAKERYSNLENILGNYHEQYDLDFMKALLRNHEKSGSICNHRDNLDTFYATILVPRKLMMLLSDGRPCEVEFDAHFL